MIRSILLCIAIAGAVGVVNAAEPCQWQIVEYEDKMDDTKSRGAVCVIESGHALSIFRSADGPVYAMLTLPKDSGEAFGSRRLRYRIDSNKAMDLEEQRSVERYVPWMKVNVGVTTTAWVIWHGAPEQQPDFGILRSILDGKTMLIRYSKFPEGTTDVEFSLEGAKPVIAEALNVKPEADPAVVAREARDRKRVADATPKCKEQNPGNRQGFLDCLRRAIRGQSPAGSM
jgi:hypothetical protein